MTNGEFRSWLQGFFELSAQDTALTPPQIQIIVNHLNLAEAVDGKLDALNEAMRGAINEFRTESRPATVEDFMALTQTLHELTMQEL